MVCITAAVGGFYLPVFWSLLSPQVVIIQQLNLLFSSVITVVDTTSAITNFRTWKHQRETEACPIRSTSEEQLFIQSRPHGSSLQDAEKVQSATDAVPGYEKQQVETIEDNLPDEYETRMIQQWSRVTDSDAQLPDDKDECPTTFGGVEIIGVICKAAGNGLRWWYRTKVPDMTLNVDGYEGLYSSYGQVDVTSAVSNGYQYVQFSPLWVHCKELPEVWKKNLWKAIGPRFWTFTELSSDAQWDGTTNLYTSEKLSRHLCKERHCEKCQG